MAATVALGKTLKALRDRMPGFRPCRPPFLWLPGELLLDEKMGNPLANLRLCGVSMSLSSSLSSATRSLAAFGGGPSVSPGCQGFCLSLSFSRWLYAQPGPSPKL